MKVDRLIGEICPGISLEQTARVGLNHPLWGPLVSLRTGSASDATLRHHASSGGALSALLLFLLDSKTVDYVVQVAASDISPIDNAIVESRTRRDVYHAAGSRYAPSSPLADLQHHLSNPGRFALVGKPCDIAAIRSLARHDPTIRQKIPFLLSFFCAGVPSRGATRQILDTLQVVEDDVASFQYRGDGWPGHAVAKTWAGREARMSYADSWGEILSKHIQFRCKICPDGSGGFADVVFGDAWHCDERGYPLFEEEEGRSLIISRSEVGERLLQDAIRAGYLNTDHLDVGEVELMQPAQARRKRLVLSRLMAMGLLRRRLPRFRGLSLWRAALSAGWWANVRSFLGMARRVLLNKL